MGHCGICDSTLLDRLHVQHFYFIGVDKKQKYDVVACRRCGLVFATHLPPQSTLDQYYRANTRHMFNQSGGTLPTGLARIHEDAFRFAESQLESRAAFKDNRGIRVLDVGSSTGHLLSLFKAAGYQNLVGLEPAKGCRQVARDLYGIQVRQTTLAHYDAEEQYDLVIMCGVLEHFRDLSRTAVQLNRLLRPKGLLLIIVPDAEHFHVPPREPFFEFAFEHVVFFTRQSLGNLLGKQGLINIRAQTVPSKHYDSASLLTLWQKQEIPQRIKRDPSGKQRVLEYITSSKNRLQSISAKIDKLVGSEEEVVVWGVGSYTTRLLASTKLGKARVLYYVDSNSAYHGQKLMGKPILPPGVLRGKRHTVFISTAIFGKEIKSTLLNQLEYQGRIIMA